MSASGQGPSSGLAPQEARVAGAVPRSYLAELQDPARARIRARVSAATAEWFDSPPGLMTWYPVVQLMELVRAIGETIGRDALRELAHRMAKRGPGQIVLPVTRTILSLGGASPAVILRRLDVIMGVLLTGAQFSYEELSPRSGHVRIESLLPMDSYYCAGWEGCLLYTFDVCPSPGGDVRLAALTQLGRAATFLVTW